MATSKTKLKAGNGGTLAAGRESLSPADWEQGALELIAEKGVAGLRVEPLARRMGITKGSFYWHFSDRDALLRKALQRWEELDDQHLSVFENSTDDPLDNLRAFFRRTSRQQLTHRVYSALLAGSQDVTIRAVLRRVTERRLAFLTKAYERLGYASGRAALHAQLTYNAYVGLIQLMPQGMAPAPDTTAYDSYTEYMIEVLLDEPEAINR
ncbi:MAG: TetR/AcrR family transcriptional regulator [Wenzhouxiangellaceae bacterium]